MTTVLVVSVEMAVRLSKRAVGLKNDLQAAVDSGNFPLGTQFGFTVITCDECLKTTDFCATFHFRFISSVFIFTPDNDVAFLTVAFIEVHLQVPISFPSSLFNQ